MSKKYAYVTLVTTNHYVPGVIILCESLRRVKSQYPLICLYTNNISKENLARLKALEIDIRLVKPIEFPQIITIYNNLVDQRLAEVYRHVLTKIEAFDLVEYNKIIFCDADLMFFKNCDHCFELPHMSAALDGEYLHWWPNNPHFNSGFLVIKPELGAKEAILNFAASERANKLCLCQSAISDQDILNRYFSNWINQPEKHLNKYYNVFPRHIPISFTNDIMQNAYVVHFINKKPWYGEIINGNAVSNYILEGLQNTVCLECYEFAYGLLLLNVNINNINWEDRNTEGLLNYYISLGAISFFKDLHSAKKYLDLALLVDPKNQLYQKLFNILNISENIDNLIKVINKDFLEKQEYTTRSERLSVKYEEQI